MTKTDEMDEDRPMKRRKTNVVDEDVVIMDYSGSLYLGKVVKKGTKIIYAKSPFTQIMGYVKTEKIPSKCLTLNMRDIQDVDWNYFVGKVDKSNIEVEENVLVIKNQDRFDLNIDGLIKSYI